MKSLKLYIENDKQILILRNATVGDLENLRQWKNSQRDLFFHTEIISVEQQKIWFNEFQNRVNDYMFIVELNGISIGCMGIRLLSNRWDIYNLILGKSEFRKKGYMGKAFNAMLNFALTVKKSEITLQVLKFNPAVDWYKKNGFNVKSEHSNFYSMIYNSFTI